jgi:putative flippase GtrA
VEKTEADGGMRKGEAMEKIIQLVKKYWSIVSYVFFGAVTTVVNLVVYYICYHMAGLNSDLSTVIAWVLAVLTAFLTNKPFVFGSHDWSMKVLLPEAGSFFGCRLGSGLVELVLMHVTVEMLGWPGMLMKLLVNVIVMILNYVASKLLVFRNK